jgi:L-malate glycosyltransferase
MVENGVPPTNAKDHARAKGSAAEPNANASDPAALALSRGARRVAIVTVGELFGGVERHVLGIMPTLRANHVEPTLFLFHEGELAIQARELGFTPVILPSRNSSTLNAAKRLARVSKARGISIIHIHGYKAAVSCVLASHWHRFAVVKTEHGLPELGTGGMMTALRAKIYHKLDLAATRRARATVCYVSDELKEHFRDAYASLPTRVIPNGIAPIDRSGLQRPQEFGAGRFNLAVVGRLEIVKGIHVAVQAMASNKFSKNIHLHIIGTGPNEAALRALAQEYGLTERIHFLGFRRTVYDFIAHCDALLMPSMHEGLPYTLLEAMALATPIIASHVGGLAEVLRNEFSALLVPPCDADALARAISRLSDNPDFGRHLAQQAQQVQQQKYSLDAMTKKYLEIYRALGQSGA